jgi:hypothetical protein
MIKVIMLASYLLTAMVSWVPLKEHSYYEKEDSTLLRYCEIALAMATVALDESRTPVFSGDDGKVKTALLLASIASTETGYEKNAVTCKRNGDNGIAFGPWQTHTSKAQTCNNLSDAAGFALNFVERSFNWCTSLNPRINPLDKLSGYTDGRCRESWQSRQKITCALKWHSSNPLPPVEIDEGEE